MTMYTVFYEDAHGYGQIGGVYSTREKAGAAIEALNKEIEGKGYDPESAYTEHPFVLKFEVDAPIEYNYGDNKDLLLTPAEAEKFRKIIWSK